MRRFSFVLSALCLIAACCLTAPNAIAGDRSAPPVRPAVTVFAAASLKESLDAAAADWTRRSGQRVVLSYGASSALARQIERGAPATIFISADREWMDYLLQRRHVDASTRFNLVGNRLVLVVPAASSTRTINLDADGALLRELGDGRLAVAETSSVPAGRYARQALARLGLWQALSTRLAQGDNVRAAMAFVAHGEAPLGIVYATDALAEKKVRVVAEFPADSHAAIIYPAARVTGARATAADGFLVYLRGPQARAIFRRAGFGIP